MPVVVFAWNISFEIRFTESVVDRNGTWHVGSLQFPTVTSGSCANSRISKPIEQWSNYTEITYVLLMSGSS